MRKIKKRHNLRIPFHAFFVLTLASALFACAHASLAQGKPVISVRGESTVEKDRISLGDISEISAGAESVRLASLSLGYSPNTGATREITREQIVMALSAAGFSIADLVLNAPSRAVIRRFGQVVSAGQVREAVEKTVLTGLSVDKVEGRITRLEIPENIRVPAGKLEVRTSFSNIRNPFARFSLPVEIRVDDRLVRTFAAGVEVESFAEVLVAAKDMAVNSRIAEADVKFERRRLVKPLPNYLFDTARLRGAMLIRNVAAGTVITAETFAAAIVVKYGDTVSLQAVSGSIKLIIVAEARGSGKIGDRIAVKNLQSGAILQAVVTDEGHARVAF